MQDIMCFQWTIYLDIALCGNGFLLFIIHITMKIICSVFIFFLVWLTYVSIMGVVLYFKETQENENQE